MPFKQINAKQAKHILRSSPAILVDIRDTNSYNESHAPEAFHLTQETLPAFINETNRDTPVLVICYHGNSSQMVADYLSGQGFSEVYSIIGGYEEWT
ncbi:thiosulfate sulfurtransferase [Dysgonomonas sp. PFB1-18]|uniref:thiosulfate sulfurtransferase GlpE n=1 Tax=unclassified Dysgonomonas TaxID=2630389 RepID=UPI00247329AF|nr:MULTISPECIES: thiosulfate sulfurtransferase GlpE [unclassified Dysgonomonas]MDH6309723.1 thiosulfate sulfurtransferase [Dysgonomonas sp. PF1-14]MDH6339269.1 thiosulfate sulfurtransferase [Dysgonomonas sp. PF1-16]MDH6380768.1 thiosulfate sulfurtransferase [Dysgonomonas sp. PFB1-18]MDH6398264.1 thiosulfate sulfurtransferase [Dysgonomonas sp. PF1-23]